jgi:hypothetical protein
MTHEKTSIRQSNAELRACPEAHRWVPVPRKVCNCFDDTVARRTLTLGSRHVSRRELEELRDSGRTIELRVLGLATVADDVPAELALATITAVEVLGAFRAPKEVKAALAGRIA